MKHIDLKFANQNELTKNKNTDPFCRAKKNPNTHKKENWDFVFILKSDLS
jgi:hypothetical protein